MTLFCAGKDPAKERWEGARYVYVSLSFNHISPAFRTGLHEVPTLFRTDDARSIDQFSTHLKSIIPSYSKIYVDVPPTHIRRGPRSTTKSILKFLSPPTAPRSEYDILVDSITTKRQPLAPEVAKLRAFKSEAEQRVMRAAADISGRAHAKVGCYSVVVSFDASFFY
jgi:intermediate cleaving peptidase 55